MRNIGGVGNHRHSRDFPSVSHPPQKLDAQKKDLAARICPDYKAWKWLAPYGVNFVPGPLPPDPTQPIPGQRALLQLNPIDI